MGAKAMRVVVVMMLGTTFWAQRQTPIENPRAATPDTRVARVPDPQFGRRRNEDEPMDAKLERERLKAWNKDRFDNLKKDTDKLLKLATELKESVDKANKDTLSLEVIRKTEEVEKLAKQVREKMKASQ